METDKETGGETEKTEKKKKTDSAAKRKSKNISYSSKSQRTSQHAAVDELNSIVRLKLL